MRRTVTITGIGPITAFGVGIDALWDAMVAGRSAVRPIGRFDATGFPCSVGAELDDDVFRVRDVVPKSYRKATKVMCRDIALAVGAADAAITDAGIVTRATDPDAEPTIDPPRMGCHIGAGLIAADLDELTAALVTARGESGGLDLGRWGAEGMENLTPLWLLKYLPNMLACHVTIIHDCRGPSNTITCAEASAALSAGESMRVIERGHADACLTGGAEYKLNLMGLLRQHFTGRLAPVNGTAPASVVRPYDERAAGTVLGEGGGILVLEAREAAEARGARLYADLAGFAATQSPAGALDADGDDAVDDMSTAMGDAMDLALADAGVEANAIDAIVPFGSGIPGVDRAEAGAIRRVFGARAARVPLVTVIPNVGNCCAGAGGVSLSLAARCLAEQRLPARLNTSGVTDLDADARDAVDMPLAHVLVLSTSLGGQHAAIVLRKA
ncbi:MAG: beta-ketoacyl-[acyl-carrier-protein] synthase family protein [Planctomycetota bacterium]|jgi:3-oxoacyl-[acyl-carrier-protein] synthase II